MLMPSRESLIAAARTAVAAEAVRLTPEDNTDAGAATVAMLDDVIATVVDSVVASIQGSVR